MNFETCKILGVPINNLNLDEAFQFLNKSINENSKKIVFTPNPEFILHALEDKEFMQILNKSDLNIADGIGVVMASKILNTPLKGRVAGIELVSRLFSELGSSQKKVYFLGATEEVILKSKENVEKKYKGIKIVGARSGYFSENEENIIIDEINNQRPDLLLVGLGCPKQERWIFKNKDILNAKVLIGVGGTFDVLSGNIKRAPKIFIKLNLEWFYRLLVQPSRFKRMLKLPLFVFKVIKFKFKGC